MTFKNIGTMSRQFTILAGIAMFATALFSIQPASAQTVATPQVVPVHSIMVDVNQPPKQIDIYKGGKILFVRKKAALQTNVRITPNDADPTPISGMMFVAVVKQNGQQVEMATGITVPPGYYAIYPMHLRRTGTGEITYTIPGVAGPVTIGTTALIVH